LNPIQACFFFLGFNFTTALVVYITVMISHAFMYLKIIITYCSKSELVIFGDLDND